MVQKLFFECLKQNKRVFTIAIKLSFQGITTFSECEKYSSQILTLKLGKSRLRGKNGNWVSGE